jgi:hypothetical protein
VSFLLPSLSNNKYVDSRLAALRRAAAASAVAVAAPLGVAVGVDRAGVVTADSLSLKNVDLVMQCQQSVAKELYRRFHDNGQTQAQHEGAT